MSDSAREHVAATLAPLIPSEWRLIDTQRMPSTIDSTTVVVKHTRFERMPQAPVGSISNEVTVTIASPREDWDRAEDELDDDVLALCMALDASPDILWNAAEKVAVNDTYLGWDITVSVRTDKE